MQIQSEQLPEEQQKVFKNKLTIERERLEAEIAAGDGTIKIGTVTKVFKSQAGKREFFLVKEPVTVQEVKSPVDDSMLFTVTGLSYNYKKASVSHKVATFTADKFPLYVKLA